MHQFDYSFLENGLLPARLLNVSTSIATLKVMDTLRKKDFTSVFTELEKIAKVQSVKSSNAIEGIVTTDDRIAAIVNGKSTPLNHNESEIAGYRDALNAIHSNYTNMDFTEQEIKKLHNTLFSYYFNEDAGQYKRKNNLILEYDANGMRNVRFYPASAEETPMAMQQLVLAYMDARNNANINQLLLIPCVILDFLCIHPFRDGNGRMSRLLTLLLLYKNGYDVGKYISFEGQINRNKASYYEALKLSSDHWADNKNDYVPFVEYFLMVLYKCYLELDKRFATVNSGKINKQSRVEATVLNSIVPISKSEICAILPDVSPTTVEAVLGKMVREDKIVKLGMSRNIKYYKK